MIVGYNFTRLDLRDSNSEYRCLASAFYLVRLGAVHPIEKWVALTPARIM